MNRVTRRSRVAVYTACTGLALAGGTHAEDAPQRFAGVDALMQEVLDTRLAIQGRPGDDTVRFPGSAERPSWFEALAVTHSENPLLEEECKKEALELTIDRMQVMKELPDDAAALEMAAAHMQKHWDFAQSHDVSYSDYLREISECRAFCAPLIASMMNCQVLAVSRSVHGIVLFEFDSDAVDPRYAGGVLANVQRQLDADPDSRLVLIGRASKVGDLKYNRRLAARRTLSVRDSLLTAGVPSDRVKTMWFGWEPPQISEWIAGEYGMADLYADEGQDRLNQSVMVVVHQ